MRSALSREIVLLFLLPALALLAPSCGEQSETPGAPPGDEPPAVPTEDPVAAPKEEPRGMPGVDPCDQPTGEPPARGAVPDFRLRDANTNSKTAGTCVSPRDYLTFVSAWYWGHTP